jgi:hypothetical protein
MYITVVLLPFVTYLLTLPRIRQKKTENQLQRHFSHHKSHLDYTETDPGPLQ